MLIVSFKILSFERNIFAENDIPPPEIFTYKISGVFLRQIERKPVSDFLRVCPLAISIVGIWVNVFSHFDFMFKLYD
jgi:hypothetical protein